MSKVRVSLTKCTRQPCRVRFNQLLHLSHRLAKEGLKRELFLLGELLKRHSNCHPSLTLLHRFTGELFFSLPTTNFILLKTFKIVMQQILQLQSFQLFNG